MRPPPTTLPPTTPKPTGRLSSFVSLHDIINTVDYLKAREFDQVQFMLVNLVIWEGRIAIITYLTNVSLPERSYFYSIQLEKGRNLFHLCPNEGQRFNYSVVKVP